MENKPPSGGISEITNDPNDGASVLPPLPHTVGDPVLRLNHFE